MKKTLYTTLIVISFFLALTAIPGGFCLLIGIAVPSVKELNYSISTDYTGPAFALIPNLKVEL